MITKKCLTASLAALSFSSEIALAAESSDAGFLITAWPLLVTSIVLIIFRKQLIVQATNVIYLTPEHTEADHHDTPAEHSVVVEDTPVAEPAKQVPASNENIDLKDGSNQCQASTAKGARCKRKSNLADTSIDFAGETYDLTVCKQHNNAALQPFSEFIK